MTIYLNMFGPFIKYQVRCYMHETWLSHQSFAGNEVLMPTSINNLRIHMISHTDCAMARYSNSALDRETTLCFLLFHEIRFPLTKTQYLEVDLMSYILPSLRLKSTQLWYVHASYTIFHVQELLSSSIEYAPQLPNDRLWEMTYTDSKHLIRNIWASYCKIIQFPNQFFVSPRVFK